MFALSQTSDFAVHKISVCFVCKNSLRTIHSLNYIPRLWIRQPLIKLRFLPQPKQIFIVPWFWALPRNVLLVVCVLATLSIITTERSCPVPEESSLELHVTVTLWHSYQAAECTVVVLIPGGKWPDTVDPMNNLQSGSQKAINTGF